MFIIRGTDLYECPVTAAWHNQQKFMKLPGNMLFQLPYLSTIVLPSGNIGKSSGRYIFCNLCRESPADNSDLDFFLAVHRHPFTWLTDGLDDNARRLVFTTLDIPLPIELSPTAYEPHYQDHLERLAARKTGRAAREERARGVNQC